MTTSGCDPDTAIFSLSALATAVPLLRTVEVPESAGEGDDGPQNRVQPQAGVVDVVLDEVVPERLQQGGPHQLDVDRAGVGLQDVPDHGVAMMIELLDHLGDEEEH